MTTKRFRYELDEIFDEGNHFAYALSKENAEDIVELLNELYEKDRDGEECYRKLLEKYDKLKEDNEQLKHYKEAYGTEIVKIKQTIKDMMENERTEIGKMTLRHLWRQIQ